jgi:tRNA G10  N-methylase Trm11
MDSQSYLFVLGRTPLLALQELRTLFPSVKQLSQDLVFLETSKPFSPGDVIRTLGGVIKIAVFLGHIAECTPETISGYLSDEGPAVEFGISIYGTDRLNPAGLSAEVKKNLESRGIRARYHTAKHGSTLSSVSVDKSHLTELIIVKTDDGYIIGKTTAVQPYESWNERDYGRPFADPKSGMLPPKVALMIVNIASDTPFGTRKSGAKTMLDPFCGMGTIVAEAYMTGWNVIGSDLSADAAKKAKENLVWLSGKYPETGGKIISVTAADASHVAEHIPPESLDAIVTEPFMGSTQIVHQPSVTREQVKNIIKGLEKLYIGCLREWHPCLRKNGLVVIALPSYTVSGFTYFVKKAVDMCENLGYTIEVGPIEYSRPQATVKREFFVFRKK